MDPITFYLKVMLLSPGKLQMSKSKTKQTKKDSLTMCL